MQNEVGKVGIQNKIPGGTLDVKLKHKDEEKDGRKTR
jgi:hypothetical protein